MQHDTTRIRAVLRASIWTLLLGGGCDPLSGAGGALPYEGCSSDTVGLQCGAGPELCQVQATASGDGICTTGCVAASDCPPSPIGEVACEPFAYRRLCVLGCNDDADCAAGTSCVELERLDESVVSLCQPE